MSLFTHLGAPYHFEFQRGGEEQAIAKFREWLKYFGSQAPNRILGVHVHVTLATSRPAVSAPVETVNPMIQPAPPAAAPLAPPMAQDAPAPVVKVVREVFDANDPNAI